MLAIETRDLTYRFSPRESVLKSIGLAVPAGSVYGFLGPNGAGKTTTLRLLLGLLRLQQGTVEIFGRSIRSHRIEILRKVGSSIESPSIYAHLTASENLRVWQTVFECPARRIGEVLALVGLDATGAKKAGAFSLGMKQRLSIAVALLHEPDLLILDEPTNGLDPHGMNDVRELLISLNRDHGTTVLVSSHLLSEIERLVTHVGIINRGSLVFEGPLAALVAKQRESSSTAIATSDNGAALPLVSSGGWTARLEGGRVVVPTAAPAEIGRINERLVMGGLSVHEIVPREPNLESIFMKLIGD